MDSERFAGLLRDVDPALADQVARGVATLSERPLPFGGEAVEVVVREQRGPRAAWYGVVDDQVRLLSGQPAAFEELARAASASIHDEAGARDYAVDLVELTRSFDQPEYPVSAVADIRMRPPLTDTETATKEEFLARYATVVTAPTATASGEGRFEVQMYRVARGVVERVTVALGGDGHADITTEPLLPTPPLPMSL